jgi:hypothetical protein
MAALILPASILLCGCSNRVDRIVGNERLIRGPGGLGTTVSVVSLTDRDSHLPRNTANFGPALLLGQSGSFDALALFKVSTWRLPALTLTGFTPIAVHFVLPQRQILGGGTGSISADLSLTSVAWDSSVAWPGPVLGASLGSTNFDFIGALRVNLGPSGFSEVQSWAADPALAPGFALVRSSSGSVGSFDPSGAVFRIFYQYTGTDSTETDSIDTHMSLSAYIHGPMNPPPTGTETAMIFGGEFECGLALRAPVPTITDGSSVNELRFLLPVTGTAPAINGVAMPDTAILSVDIYRIRAPWTEGVTDQAALTIDASPVSHLILPQFLTAQDTALSIPLPRVLTREWGADSTTNQGVLIRIRDVTVRPSIDVFRIAQTPGESPSFLIGSRESTRPPVLRFSTTTPPPGRF